MKHQMTIFFQLVVILVLGTPLYVEFLHNTDSYIPKKIHDIHDLYTNIFQQLDDKVVPSAGLPMRVANLSVRFLVGGQQLFCW